MAFCKNCGQPLNPGEQFCSKCGAPADGAQQDAQQNTQQNAYSQNAYSAPASGGKDHTAEFAPDDIQANHGISVLGYFGILLLIPLLTKPDSRFVKFHCNQGLVLAIFEIGLSIVDRIFANVPVLSVIIAIVYWVAAVAMFVFWIMGIVNAAQGKAKELPVIGSINIIKY